MPKYTHLKKIYLPLTGYKTERTVSIANDGRKVFGGIGNEGLDVGLWIQEKIDDGTIITGGVDLTALIALTGMPAGSSDLDTFTGSIISDNTNIKNALQELETYIESSIAYTDEQSQDAVGSILLDSATIDFTYNDGTPSITASVINNSITFAKIQQISTQTLLGRSTAGTGNVEQITLGTNLQLSGGVLDLSFTPTDGTVTSVALSLPSFITVSGSPVTTTGTLTGTLATQTANTIFAGPTTGVDAQPTFRTLVAADIPTLLSTKISDFNEAVDDRVDALLVAGTNITLTYDDGAGTITIDASDSSYTNEEAQDAIGAILLDTDTINLIYTDVTPTIEAHVNTQMSITSDASGLKLLGDESSPGNLQYYGTDGGGNKGFYSFPSSSIPSGTPSQTLRYDNTSTLVANSNLLNDGTYAAIGGSIVTGIRLFVNGAVRNAGIFHSRGTGAFGSSTSSSELRLENTTANQTWYIHSSNGGELQIGSNAPSPELIIDTNSDILIENKLSVGNLTNTPTTVLGADNDGYIGALTLGAGMSLIDGVLDTTAAAVNIYTSDGFIPDETRTVSFSDISTILLFQNAAEGVLLQLTDDTVYLMDGVAVFDADSIEMTTSGGSLDLSGSGMTLSINNGDALITDNRVTKLSLQYFADYSNDWTDRSIPDVGGVKTMINGIIIPLTLYLEGATGTTFDLGADLTDIEGNPFFITIDPGNEERLLVYRNGYLQARNGTIITRDYSIDTGTNEIIFEDAITSSDIILLKYHDIL